MTFSFVLKGPPRSKNTGKVSTKFGVRVFPSKPYQKWFKSAKQQAPIGKMAARAAGITLPIASPVNVTGVFYRDRNIGDEDRYKIGLGDYLQRCGFIVNDSQIHWTGESRREIDRVNPRVEVTIEVVT